MQKFLFIFLFLPLFANAQIITTVAGGGTVSLGDGGPATAAKIPDPQNIVFDKFGNLYISDIMTSTIRKVDVSGTITTIAGTGTTGSGGDGGLATAADMYYPQGVACDTSGNLYIADRDNYRVRKIDISTGIISAFVGTGVTNFAGSGDGGPATAAQFNTPSDVKFDKKGNLYIADNSAGAIRKVNAAGVISTFAGIGGSIGFSGDGGPATAAQVRDPRFITFDDTGNLYISECIGHRIRKVDTFGIIHTIAGTGLSIYNGDSLAATSTNISPTGIVFYNNAIYFAGSDHRIRKVDLIKDTIYTIAGNGTHGFIGDGLPAITAEVYNPWGIIVHDCGDLYIADADNSRVRKIALPPTIPSISLSGIIRMHLGSTVTVNATVLNAGSSYFIHWMNHGIQFATTAIPSVTFTKSAGIDTITAKVIPVAASGCYDSITSALHIVFPELGVNTITTADGFTIYPNPGSNILNITGDKITSVAIHTLLGQVVFSHEYSASQAHIDIAGLPGGIYLVKINGTVVTRFVKQ